jgi:hypothetical protein
MIKERPPVNSFHASSIADRARPASDNWPDEPLVGPMALSQIKDDNAGFQGKNSLCVA